MRTLRAKRLERYLNKRLGWETTTGRLECLCGWYTFSEDTKFCGNCGAKLPKKRANDEVYEELEDAIAYALKEKK